MLGLQGNNTLKNDTPSPEPKQDPRAISPAPQGSRRREIALFLVYLGLATATALVWTRIADMSGLPGWHSEMIRGIGPAPSQYRPLTPWLAEGLRLILPTAYMPLAYFAVRALATAFVLYFFDRYMRCWFKNGAAAAAAMCLAAVLPFTYFRVIQESDTINLLVFILAFWALARGRDLWLLPLVLIGTLNRETTAMIPVIYLLARWRAVPTTQVALRTAMLIGAWAAVYGGLRLAYGPLPYYCDFLMWKRNLANWLPTVHVLLLFGAVWVLAFIGARRGPQLLRRAVWLLPPFMILHYVVALVMEVRLFLPFAPVLVPLAWWVLFPQSVRDDATA
jgi:hypothetical protein